MSYEIISTPGSIGSIRGLKIELGEETKLILNKDAYYHVQYLGALNMNFINNDGTKPLVNAVRDLQLVFEEAGIDL